MPLAEATRAEIARARDRYPHPKSAILPALWAVQHELGYLSPDGMAEVAQLLGLTPSQVQAVSTFYSMYFRRPPGRHHVVVCVNVACALRGSDDLVASLEEALGCPSGDTTADGQITWEATVECLGACGGAPAAQVDHHFHENLTPESVVSLAAELRGGAAQSLGTSVGSGRATPDRDGVRGRAKAAPHPPTGETPPDVTTAGPPSGTPRAGSSSSTGAPDPVVSTRTRRRKDAGSTKRPRPTRDDL